jgi:N-acetylglutamate synthase-like GNAT family acetyltransferase
MIIRPYRAADKQACLDAFKSNMPESFTLSEMSDFEIWLDEQTSTEASNDDTIAEQYFVAEKDHHVVGCGGYYIDLARKEGTMTWGLVNKTNQKQSIGKELFQYRLQAIHSICSQCTVYLDTTQHVYRFFAKWGFVITKITKDYYAKGLDRYDMILKQD